MSGPKTAARKPWGLQMLNMVYVPMFRSPRSSNAGVEGDFDSEEDALWQAVRLNIANAHKILGHVAMDHAMLQRGHAAAVEVANA